MNETNVPCQFQKERFDIKQCQNILIVRFAFKACLLFNQEADHSMILLTEQISVCSDTTTIIFIIKTVLL